MSIEIEIGLLRAKLAVTATHGFFFFFNGKCSKAEWTPTFKI